MKEDTIQHLASEMDELQEQHRDVLARVRFSINIRLTPCRYLTATTSTPFVCFFSNLTSIRKRESEGFW